MDSPFLRRLIWNVVPTVLVVGAVWMVLAGEEGLLNRHALKQQLLATQAQVERVDEENQQLLLRVRALRADRAAVEREIADKLNRAPKKSVIYRFDD